MIAESNSPGLIVAGDPQATGALNELMIRCGWPAFLKATPRQLRNAILQRAPKSLLFWLDDQRDLAATLRLLAWLAAYQPAVRRVAVGYQLSANIEGAFRGAGAHVYVAAADNIRELVDGPIFRWLRSEGGCNAEARRVPAGCQTALDIDLLPNEPP